MAGAAWLPACPRPPFFKMPCTAVVRCRGDHEASLCPSSSFLCSLCINQIAQSHDNIPSVPQGTSGSDLPPCQHPEEVRDPERGQGGHLYVCVPPVSGSHAGLCQDRCCPHRGLRWIQRWVLGWEDHGLWVDADWGTNASVKVLQGMSQLCVFLAERVFLVHSRLAGQFTLPCRVQWGAFSRVTYAVFSGLRTHNKLLSIHCAPGLLLDSSGAGRNTRAYG